MDDVRESIRELQYYREHLLRRFAPEFNGLEDPV
jgi:oligoribonuclease (3'-5' exoribonuclease)